MNEPRDAIRIGPHALWTEGTDIAHVAWHGDVLPEHILELNRNLVAMPGKDDGIFLVMRLHALGAFKPEARKTITTDPNATCVRVIVVIGATFHMRVLMGMINKAMAVFRKSRAPMVFFDTEEEAAAHIEAVRREHPQGHIG